MGRKKAFRIYGDYPELMGVPEEIKREAMPQVVKHVAEIARAEAPKRAGLSSSKSIVSRIKGSVEKAGLVGRVRAGAPHSHLIEFGTRPHSLASGSGKSKKKPGSRLKIFGDPSIIRMSAMHPGSAANPFMQRADDKAPPVVERVLMEIGAAALDHSIHKTTDLIKDLFGDVG